MPGWRCASAYWIGVLVLFGVGGCGRSGSAPETCEVTGEVVYANGTPVAGGEVRFQPTTAADLTVTGSIESGAFRLRTISAGGAADGAPPGKYTVSVTLPGDHRTTSAAVVVERPEVTVEAGQANRLRIRVKPLTPRR